MNVTISTPKVLGVVPARGGSKRLPRKNLLPLAGKPLIAHTILSCQKTKALTDWLVSTEDEEIAEVAKAFGAPVPFIRPAELADDKTRNTGVLLHAMHYMERQRNLTYDIIVLLQPTCPLRRAEDIDAAVNLLHGSGCETLASVRGPLKKRDKILKRVTPDNLMMDYCTEENATGTVRPFYLYNASIYAMTRKHLVEKQSFVSGVQVPLVMDDLHSLDIDTELDYYKAQAYFSYLQDKGHDKN